MTHEMVNTLTSMMASPAGKMMVGTYVAISLALSVLLLIGKWKLFTKMGEKGWKSLIPIYSDYLLFKNVWSGKAFLRLINFTVVAGVATMTATVLTGVPQMAALVFGCALMIAALVMVVKYAMKLSRCFGHGTGYGLGLLFAEPLFDMILGFGKSEFSRA